MARFIGVATYTNDGKTFISFGLANAPNAEMAAKRILRQKIKHHPIKQEYRLFHIERLTEDALRTLAIREREIYDSLSDYPYDDALFNIWQRLHRAKWACGLFPITLSR